jgi:hypothetical protein
MSTYGHPSDVAARERLRLAFTPSVTPLPVASRSQPLRPVGAHKCERAAIPAVPRISCVHACGDPLREER